MKKILILSLNNGDMASQVSKEVLLQFLVEDMTGEGKKPIEISRVNPSEKEIIFDDNSVIHSCTPEKTRENYYTHIYIDDSMSPENYKAVLNKANNLLTDSGFSFCGNLLDLEGSRVNSFSVKNGQLSITKR